MSYFRCVKCFVVNNSEIYYYIISWLTRRRYCQLFIIAKFDTICGSQISQYLQSLCTYWVTFCSATYHNGMYLKYVPCLWLRSLPYNWHPRPPCSSERWFSKHALLCLLVNADKGKVNNPVGTNTQYCASCLQCAALPLSWSKGSTSWDEWDKEINWREIVRCLVRRQRWENASDHGITSMKAKLWRICLVYADSRAVRASLYYLLCLQPFVLGGMGKSSCNRTTHKGHATHKNKWQQAGNNAIISGDCTILSHMYIDFSILQSHSHTHTRAHADIPTHPHTPCVKCEKVMSLVQLLRVLASCCLQPCNKAKRKMKEARFKTQYSHHGDDFVAGLLSGM